MIYIVPLRRNYLPTDTYHIEPPQYRGSFCGIPSITNLSYDEVPEGKHLCKRCARALESYERKVKQIEERTSKVKALQKRIEKRQRCCLYKSKWSPYKENWAAYIYKPYERMGSYIFPDFLCFYMKILYSIFL